MSDHEPLAALPAVSVASPRARALWLPRPEYCFLWISIVFGLLFLVVIPPFQAGDEPEHFKRAYQISQGQFVAQKIGDESGGRLPLSLGQTAWHALGKIPFHTETKFQIDQFPLLFGMPLEPQITEFTDFRNAALYTPIPYAPQALGIGIGRVLGLPPLVLMYLGRASALAASLAITFFALRIMPVARWVMLLIALVPVVAFQRSTLSADNLTNSLTFLFVAVAVHYALVGQRLRARDMLILATLAVLVALAKQVYVVLALLYLLVPRAKLPLWRHYAGGFVVVVGAACAALIGWSLIAAQVHESVRSVAVIAPEAQVEQAALQPLRVAGVVTQSVIRNASYYSTSMIGGMGWDVQLARPLSWLFLLALIGAALVGGDGKVFGLRQRAVLLGTSGLGFLLILGVAYVLWNDVGSREIYGVQGRYFIPLLPLLLLALYGLTTRGLTRVVRPLVVTFAIAAQCYTLVALVLRFYVIW